jgi:hypothetical protein
MRGAAFARIDHHATMISSLQVLCSIPSAVHFADNQNYVYFPQNLLEKSGKIQASL